MLHAARMRVVRVLLLCAAFGGNWAQAQVPQASGEDLKDAVRELRSEVRELREAVADLRAESQRYRAETERLRRQMEVGQTVEPPGNAAVAQAASSVNERIASLEDEQQLLKQKVDEQYQTKLESASKYRVRLSGIVLLNAFNNQGAVDSIDVPTLAMQRSGLITGGSAGASVRQSQLGLEVFGPEVAGAHSRADVQVDLGGGFPPAPNAVTTGLMRLRTATARLDWERTSVIAGQDTLFLAPQSPTSFASLIVPPLSYAGNLWAWAPQIRVEHRFQLGESAGLTLQGGLLDPLTGQPPYSEYSEYYRQATAGENSRRPGLGGRAAWSQRILGRDLVFGTAGYFSKQIWGFNRQVNGWLSSTDWQIPFTSWLKLTGDFYRGSGIGGFGAGTERSVLYSGPFADPATKVRALNTMGGWAQLKVIPAPKFEFNGAAGQDNPFSRDLRAFASPTTYVNPLISRNRAEFVNFIYRPRSDLILSAEFRRLRTFEVTNDSYTANHVNLGVGFLF